MAYEVNLLNGKGIKLLYQNRLCELNSKFTDKDVNIEWSSITTAIEQAAGEMLRIQYKNYVCRGLCVWNIIWSLG